MKQMIPICNFSPKKRWYSNSMEKSFLSYLQLAWILDMAVLSSHRHRYFCWSFRSSHNRHNCVTI